MYRQLAFQLNICGAEWPQSDEWNWRRWPMKMKAIENGIYRCSGNVMTISVFSLIKNGWFEFIQWNRWKKWLLCLKWNNRMRYNLWSVCDCARLREWRENWWKENHNHRWSIEKPSSLPNQNGDGSLKSQWNARVSFEVRLQKKNVDVRTFYSGDKWFIIPSIDNQFLFSFAISAHPPFSNQQTRSVSLVWCSFRSLRGICYSSISFPLAMSTEIAVSPNSTRAKLRRSY